MVNDGGRYDAMDVLREGLEPGEDERQQDHGAPDGAERRIPRETPFARVERGVNRVGAITGAVVVIGGALGLGAFFNWPFYMKAEAKDAFTSVAKHEAEQDARLEVVERRLGSIDKNGLRTLNLQLRAALRSIDNDLKTMPESAPGRQNLEAQRDQTALDLRENQRQLDAGN